MSITPISYEKLGKIIAHMLMYGYVHMHLVICISSAACALKILMVLLKISFYCSLYILKALLQLTIKAEYQFNGFICLKLHLTKIEYFCTPTGSMCHSFKCCIIMKFSYYTIYFSTSLLPLETLHIPFCNMLTSSFQCKLKRWMAKCNHLEIL